MKPRILIAGIGNIFLSDDGFGPAVIARLAEPDGSPSVPDHVRVVDYGIRGMHLAYDLLDDWQALVMVDALPDHGQPGRVTVLEIAADQVRSCGQVDAHGMDPATVLSTLEALGGRLPARTLLVGCQVAVVRDGMGLSPVVEAAVARAAGTVVDLLAGELDARGVA